jgi:hypothetical protein
MPISDHIPRTAKLKGRVVTVDPPTRRIEVVAGDGTIRQVAIFEVPSGFNWPVVGEVWTIYQENGYWFLGNRWQQDDDPVKIEDLQPGEGLVSKKFDAVNQRIDDTTSALNTRVAVLESDRSEWLKPQERYGTGIPAVQGGVAPGVVENSRSQTGVFEVYASVLGDMRITVTPAKNCWVRARANVIGLPSDAGWVRIDWYIDLTGGADARSRTRGTIEIMPGAASVSWMTATPEALFKCSANIPYTMRLLGQVSSGTWNYWYGGSYLSLQSEVIGFW